MKPTQKTIKYFIYLTILMLVFPFCSCKKQEQKEILSEKLKESNFTDQLEITGIVEAVRSATISFPNLPTSKIIYLIKDGTPVKEGDVLCILKSEEMLKYYDETVLQLNNVKTSRDRSVADLNMQYALLDAQVKSNAAQTAISNLDSLQLKYLSPKNRQIKELELKKAAIEKAKMERKLKALGVINQLQISNLDRQIQFFEFNVTRIKDELNKLTIKSTQAGTAYRAYSYITNAKFKEGDDATEGMQLINLPDFSEMKVTISAAESDYKQINVNDSVEFTFDAKPGLKTRGKILMKEPIGQPIKEKSKVKIFKIEAAMDKGPNLPDPGFTANCKIILKRVCDTLVVPQLAVFEEDSMKVVYVKKGKDYEKRQVLVGSSSLKDVIITRGLKRNEQVSLIKPESKKVKKTTLLPKPVKKIKNKANDKSLKKKAKTKNPIV